MTLTKSVKKFIENNLDLLENNPRAFVGKAMLRMIPTDLETLIKCLEEANIVDNTIIDSLIENHLAFMFPVVEDRTHLTDFIKTIFSPGCTTYLGKTERDLEKFIREHKDAWDEDMFLDVDAFGITIIRKR